MRRPFVHSLEAPSINTEKPPKKGGDPWVRHGCRTQGSYERRLDAGRHRDETDADQVLSQAVP
jgi:hypothetical protein